MKRTQSRAVSPNRHVLCVCVQGKRQRCPFIVCQRRYPIGRLWGQLTNHRKALFEPSRSRARRQDATLGEWTQISRVMLG